MPPCTVTTGGCLGVEVMVMVHIWLSRRLLSPSYTTKWKMSVTGWLPVSKEVMYLSVKRSYLSLMAALNYPLMSINVCLGPALQLHYVLSQQHDG